MAPVAVVLVAENLGHLKAVSAMTGRDLDPYLGRTFLGDGRATLVSRSVGGTGVTPYREDVGVMAVTRIDSTLIFGVAATIALVAGFSPEFGALIRKLPGPVLGAVSIVSFGLIAVSGARIWVQDRGDFADPRHLHRRRRDAGARRRTFQREARRVPARRDRYRDLRGDPPPCAPAGARGVVIARRAA